ncbi:lysine biosynthesis protein LysW [Candidatus Roizmanbacteria bacterium]|nr:lysine biosynthesis protein LysW [Candidatus Roizmanbacteria bacterium]
MQTFKTPCPICDATLNLSDVEVTEIVSCPECRSRLVIGKIKSNQIQLSEAPAVDEDWGE